MKKPAHDTRDLQEPVGERRRASVFTVPAGRPFLDALAKAILDGHLPRAGGAVPAPLDLPDITLLLPTRRATRALQEAFLRAGAGRAMLLPAIRPIGEGDEELSLLTSAAELPATSAEGAEIPPAITEMERRLVLTNLVLRWSEAQRRREDGGLDPFSAAGADTPAKAAHLAKELGRLMDMIETEGASFERIAGLVPDNLSEHWQKTLSFLEIVTAMWPQYLQAQGLISPAERRNRLIEAEARHLEEHPPNGPVIVAGVTGSIPATVKLMRAVARLDKGAIVLPALDTGLDEAAWQAIVPQHPEHPQFGLKKLLDALGLERESVHTLPGATADAVETARQQLVSEMMRPASTTERWHIYAREASREAAGEALAGLNLIEAPGAQDEAEAVALILREAAETPGRTAALVSPDRLLARRVAVRLESWGIRVDDSAGRPFAKTVPGAFLDLVIETIAKDFAPPELMALLKHPLTRLGLNPFEVRRAARTLELAAFRAPYLGRGLDGVDDALERAARETAPEAGTRRHRAVRRLRDDDWHQARDLVLRLRNAFAPLLHLYGGHGAQPLRAFAEAHRESAAAIARLPEEEAGEEDASSALWRGEAGTAANRFFQGLADETLPELAIASNDYPDLYRGLIQGENVRPRVPVHPRLSIWGPFEARLQQPDVVVLGSLNDGTWPEAADPGPWLNRPMRAELTLPSPEERIGYSAHDFATLLGAPKVFLTRAEKVDGVPTVPSRWLLRLEALLDGMGQATALKLDQPWLGWARSRDHIDAAQRQTISRPEPRPPAAVRPRKLSVSRVEAWIGNPYAIYAREILGLEPLDGLGLPPSPALRGSIIHEALSRFSNAHPVSLPGDAAGALIAFAREVLDEHAAHPRVAAFWVPRFERFARWFADTEPERRSKVEKVAAEITGALTFDAPGGPFTVTARADRIDVSEEGLVITDYKTGQIPSEKEVTLGLAPQLPLEAAIALSAMEDGGEAGGFANLGRHEVTGLRYIRATGGEPPGEERRLKASDIAALAAAQLDGLKRLVTCFDDETTPYAPVRRAGFSYDYDDYAHLARIAEWSLEQPDGGES